ncbi:hypothetical protein GCM10009776_03270 [Microbacterium deminutum]|uniref:ATP-binding protein n=1 Tax=Microbacterium deminutum TaxID=344164 RepID=A0ABN2Q5L6_9MICO
MASDTIVLKLRVGNRFAALSAPGALPRREDMRGVAALHARESGNLDDAQLAAASAIAGTSRLVSITGPAGGGKTMLLRVARTGLELQRRRVILERSGGGDRGLPSHQCRLDHGVRSR